MSQQPARGISRQGLDAAFQAEEERKSNLILEARLLREQGRDEAAAPACSPKPPKLKSD